MKNIKTVLTATALCSVLLCGGVWADDPHPAKYGIMLLSCSGQQHLLPPGGERLTIVATSQTAPKGWALAGTTAAGQKYTLFAAVGPAGVVPTPLRTQTYVHVTGTTGADNTTKAYCYAKAVP